MGAAMSEHSPGPWRRGGQCKFVDEPGNPHFVELQTGTDIWHEENGAPAPVLQLEDWFNDADIPLIAAAPEMLALLWEMMAPADKMPPWLDWRIRVSQLLARFPR